MDPALLREREAFKKKALATPRYVSFFYVSLLDTDLNSTCALYSAICFKNGQDFHSHAPPPDPRAGNTMNTLVSNIVPTYCSVIN